MLILPTASNALAAALKQLPRLEELVWPGIEWTDPTQTEVDELARAVFERPFLRRVLLYSLADGHVDMSSLHARLADLVELDVSGVLLPHLTAPKLQLLTCHDVQTADCTPSLVTLIASCRLSLQSMRFTQLQVDKTEELFAQPLPLLETLVTEHASPLSLALPWHQLLPSLRVWEGYVDIRPSCSRHLLPRLVVLHPSLVDAELVLVESKSAVPASPPHADADNMGVIRNTALRELSIDMVCDVAIDGTTWFGSVVFERLEWVSITAQVGVKNETCKVLPHAGIAALMRASPRLQALYIHGSVHGGYWLPKCAHDAPWPRADFMYLGGASNGKQACSSAAPVSCSSRCVACR